MNKRIGSQTVRFKNPPVIIAASSIVGTHEGDGPLKEHFDIVLEDDLHGQKSWEKAESKITEDNLNYLVGKAGLTMEDIDYILSGDLLNQTTGSTFGIRRFKRPFFGLFGACSTMGEAMSLGAMLVDGGFAYRVVTGASSHFCSAEKQFRFPLDLGTQKTPTSSRTVTGDGAVILCSEGKGPVITEVTTGKIIDLGVTDPNNMGAAMAPAAADTIMTHFRDTGKRPEDYDVIATGDLGYVGKELAAELLAREGYVMGNNFTDCGIEIFDKEKQDTHNGGSGCACAAVTFAGYYYRKLRKGDIKNILLVPTGALMSPTSTQQGESIPGIAHAVAVEGRVR